MQVGCDGPRGESESCGRLFGTQIQQQTKANDLSLTLREGHDRRGNVAIERFPDRVRALVDRFGTSTAAP
jgi:hypothetical protein